MTEKSALKIARNIFDKHNDVACYESYGQSVDDLVISAMIPLFREGDHIISNLEHCIAKNIARLYNVEFALPSQCFKIKTKAEYLKVFLECGVVEHCDNVIRKLLDAKKEYHSSIEKLARFAALGA